MTQFFGLGCARPVILGVLLSSTFATTAAAQIKVSLSVSESDASVITSGFRNALRSLSDVELVTPAEEATYRINVVVVCGGGCRGANTYAVAVRLEEPLGYSGAATIISYIGGDIGASPPYPIEAEEKLSAAVGRYSLTRFFANHVWGRDAYESGIRELVAEFDTECFEKTRIQNRALSPDVDTAVASALLEEAFADHWMC